MEIIMLKILHILQWLLFPVAFVFYDVSLSDYQEWFQTHWIRLIGNTAGITYAGVDGVMTMNCNPLTYNFEHDMYLVFITCLKAACVVLVTLTTTRLFKKRWPDDTKSDQTINKKP